MKPNIGMVPSSALAYGMEAKVHLYAVEHRIGIDSKEAYQMVSRLMWLLEDVERIKRQLAVAQHSMDTRWKQINRVRKELGWQPT
jgi:hypothetical protein